MDKDKLGEKLEALQKQLNSSSEKLKQLGNMPITQFQLINHDNKKTLSSRHASTYAEISQNSVHHQVHPSK